MIEDLKNKILSCAIELFGNHFKFRPGQLDVIEQIVNNVISNVKQTVLEAPTGSGKSIIGIIAAYVLFRLYGKKSYILVSDLSLFDQYQNDIENLHVNCFGFIKGKENYRCANNGCKVSQSTCSLQGVSIRSLMYSYNPEFPCAKRCQYIHNYVKAIESPITLMTYQLYFIQRNYVEDDVFGGKNKNFPQRDLVICDECHKISDICQNHFAPNISIHRPSWMSVLDKYTFTTNDYDDQTRSNIVNNILNCTDQKKLSEYVREYEDYIGIYADVNEKIRKSLKDKPKLTKKDKEALFAGNTARQEHCKFEDILNFVDQYKAYEYLVKTADIDTIALNFIFDNIMLIKYFHEKSGCELLMSATVNDFDNYAVVAGLDLDTFKHISIPSTFDFKKSPIFFSDDNRMSYEEKDKSFNEICKQVIHICERFKKYRGIIQTGSYMNADILKGLLPDDVLSRCLFYKGAKDKAQRLNEFLAYGNFPEDNHILIGPTLIEGLNFPDDLCRFQICIKIPYAFLGSEYVRKKKDLIAGWYEYDAINKICQGIGRGVRHKDDWCVNFILDGCISYLVEKLDKLCALHGRFKKYIL